jgi:hypothetical protein
VASKIGKTEWRILIAVTCAIDFVQLFIIELVLVWFFGVGAIINVILDPILAGCYIVYFQLRGVNLFKRPQRILSMAGVEVAAEITGGIAQLWFLDVWYIKKDVEKEQAMLDATKQEKETSNMLGAVNALNQNGTRKPQSSNPPLNQGGTRLPSMSNLGTEVRPVIQNPRF